MVRKGKRKGDEQGSKESVQMDMDNAEELEFEDEFGDEVEEEDVIDGGDEEMMEEADDAEDAGSQNQTRVWRKGVDTLGEDEVMEYDNSAYDMLHRMNTDWPCLSFAIVQDRLGQQRTKYPMTAFAVCGTQAEQAKDNHLICMKMSQMCRTKHDDDSNSEDDSDEDDADEDPVLEHAMVPHMGTVNRIRLMPQNPHIASTWADTGKVHLWDLSAQLQNLTSPGTAKGPPSTAPAFTFSGHTAEGFAMDWSPVSEGKLATGDCAHNIHLWSSVQGGWAVDPKPFQGHTDSVEDIQWSPTEATVFISCGVDKSLRVWDVRKKGGAALTNANAHDCDVNVVSWNKSVSYLLVSGADSGAFSIWDLRNFGNFSNGSSVAHFKWHTGAITSVEWNPNESSSIAVSGADDCLSLWDLALEDDPEADRIVQGRADLQDVPAQLYFVHQGQTDLKESHWHPQLPGVLMSTAGDSFHVLKPANA